MLPVLPSADQTSVIYLLQPLDGNILQFFLSFYCKLKNVFQIKNRLLFMISMRLQQGSKDGENKDSVTCCHAV